jgi:hypothetical protein
MTDMAEPFTIDLDRDPDKCTRVEVFEGVWECLEKRRCRYCYCYGGDSFCKRPHIADEAKRRIEAGLPASPGCG